LPNADPALTGFGGGSGSPGYGVLFDIDDTLVDFAGAARLALLDVAARFPGASPETPAQVLRSWEVVSEREYNRFLSGEVGFDDMLVARMAAVIAEIDPSGADGLDAVELERLRNESIFTHYRQYDDVAGALVRLAAAGIPVGVISNSDGPYQRRKMAAAGLDELIDTAVFSGDLGVSKPDPKIFLAGAASLGLAPQQVVYVGDRWATDTVGALTAGLAAIWLNRLGHLRPEAAAEHLLAIPGAADRLVELPDLAALDAALIGRMVAAQPSG
jgi:putative hydrolase of the HAD superfamily